MRPDTDLSFAGEGVFHFSRIKAGRHAEERSFLALSLSLPLTGYSGGVGVLVRVLHVLHEGLAAEEHLVAQRAGGGVGAADQCCMLLQPTNTLLTELAR